MEFKISIPVSNLVNAYLINKFRRPSYAGQIILNQSSYEGKYFFSLLGKEDNKKKVKTEYPQTLQVCITEDVWLKSNVSITPISVIRFNRFISEQVHSMLHIYVDAQIDLQKKINVSASIKKFLSQYKFTEDSFAFETAKKSYQRHVQATKKNKKAIETDY